MPDDAPEAGSQRIVVEEQAVALDDGARLEVRQQLDERWRKLLSLRGRTATYTGRVHALIAFLARLRVGLLVVPGCEDGWSPYDLIADLPGWEQCRDRQRLRETLLHEFDLVTGRFFQRSTLNGEPRIRITQRPETIAVDDSPSETLALRQKQKRDSTSEHEYSVARLQPVAIPNTLAPNTGHESTLRGGHIQATGSADAIAAQLPGVQRSDFDDASRDMILESPSIRAVFSRVVDAARRGVRLMLVGPSGSGKDGLARCYHRYTGRAGAFVSKNCAMFSRELLRGELFGIEPGAFTGATRSIVGAVEAANGGTLFLDEIGEMPPAVQPQLLTFLDRGEYERIGASRSRLSDVRVVCATNRDLRELVVHGGFREDLWYRLSQEIVEVPALRERPDDIAAYLRSIATPQGMSVWDRLTPDARSFIFEYSWPGNFRELGNFVARLPQDDQSIDGDSCRRELSHTAILALPSKTTKNVLSGWGNLAQQAALAFAEDAGHEADSWTDVKECIERYLKPLLFAQLSGGSAALDEIPVPAIAERIGADRGTVLKQLARFRERFRR